MLGLVLDVELGRLATRLQEGYPDRDVQCTFVKTYMSLQEAVDFVEGFCLDLGDGSKGFAVIGLSTLHDCVAEGTEPVNFGPVTYSLLAGHEMGISPGVQSGTPCIQIVGSLREQTPLQAVSACFGLAHIKSVSSSHPIRLVSNVETVSHSFTGFDDVTRFWTLHEQGGVYNRDVTRCWKLNEQRGVYNRQQIVEEYKMLQEQGQGWPALRSCMVVSFADSLVNVALQTNEGYRCISQGGRLV